MTGCGRKAHVVEALLWVCFLEAFTVFSSGHFGGCCRVERERISELRGFLTPR